jgi:tetratricopeptide (TPR) repeat protein
MYKYLIAFLFTFCFISEIFPAGGSDANIETAITWYEQGRLDNAETALKIEEAGNSSDPRIYFDLGLINYDKNIYDKSESYYLKTIGIDSNYAPAYTEMANLRCRQNKLPEAEKFIEKSIGIDSNYANSYMVYANIYTLMGRKSIAEEQLEKAARLSPGLVFGQGTQYLKISDPDSALYYFKIAEKYSPREPVLLFHIGQTYRMLKDPADALKYLELSYNYAPTNYQYFNFGIIYSTYFRYSLDNGSYDNIYKRVFEKVGKTYPGAYMFLALADYKTKKSGDFREHAKKYFLYGNEKEPASLEDWASNLIIPAEGVQAIRIPAVK